MSCIARNPNCGLGESKDETVPDVLPNLASVLGIIGGIISAVVGVIGALDKVAEVVGTLGGLAGSSTIGGALAVIGVIILIGLFGLDRCQEGEGQPTCIAGAVSNIEESFSDAAQELFPFASQHTRVDVTVKSFFWDWVEQSNAYVYCTDAAYPRRSEIMRCYYFTERVCNAVAGSMIGAVIGGVGGIIAAAAIGGAIGCAASGPFYLLCLLVVLLLAAIVAAAAALIGAFIGGQIAKAASDDALPTTSSGSTIAFGDLVTVNGNMQQRDYDAGANVMWWAHTTSFHGRVLDGTQQPYSYCEIDEQLLEDACTRPEEPEPEPPR